MQNTGKQRFLFLIRLHLQLNFLILLQKLELLPALGNQRFQLAGRMFVNGIIAVKGDKGKERISRRDFQFTAALRLILGVKSCVSGAEPETVFVRPHLARFLSHRFMQLCKTAKVREPDIIYFRQLIKVHKLIIDFIFLLLSALGNDADYLPRNGHHPEEFHNAYPLVALLHIKPVHVFIRLDGVSDSLLHMAGA